MSDLRSPLAKARDKWFASVEGERCCDFETVYGERYLKNRLEQAFIAGAEWAIKEAVKEMKKK